MCEILFLLETWYLEVVAVCYVLMLGNFERLVLQVHTIVNWLATESYQAGPGRGPIKDRGTWPPDTDVGFSIKPSGAICRGTI